MKANLIVKTNDKTQWIQWKGIGKLSWMLATLLGTGYAVYWYASNIATKRFRLEQLRIALDNAGKPIELPVVSVNGANYFSDTNGRTPKRILRVLHLSDLHLSEPDHEKANFIREITAEAYDLVVLTGDIFENETGLRYAPSLLTKMPAIGAFAVLGNHDYYAYTLKNRLLGRLIRKMRHPKEIRNVQPMIGALEKTGFIVLRNQAVSLPGHRIKVLGIDYPGIQESELQQLVMDNETDHLLVALFHLPRNLEHMQKAGIHVAFGGHTHGGQVRLPGVGAIITDSELPRHEASGIVRRGNTIFHISRGLGSDPRTNFRLFCPPTATVVEIYQY